MASPEDSTGSDREKHDLIKNNTEYLINTYSYKTIQKMASHRKLSANLRKNEMAKLVALHDAGAMEDLKQVTEEFKATRTKKRQLTYAVAHQGYGTTTAEADSASANPDVDDDNVFSPLNEDFGDGDEDYDPHAGSRRSNEYNSRVKPKKRRTSKGAASGKLQTAPSSYDATVAASPPTAVARTTSMSATAAGSAGLPGAWPGASGSQGPAAGSGLVRTLSPVVAANTTSALGAPSALPLPTDLSGTMAVAMCGAPEQERPGFRTPVYRRSVGNSALGAATPAGRARVNKARAPGKVQRDASYLYSKMAPGLPPPYSVACSPGPGHPVSADRSGFETPSQFYGSAFRPPAPYGHATPTALNPIGRAGYQPWTYGHQSKMLPSFHNPGQNTYASHLKQFVSQPTHQNGHSYSQPDFCPLPPQYTSKTSPDSSNQAYPNQHQMLNQGTPKYSGSLKVPSLKYQNFKSEKILESPYYMKNTGIPFPNNNGSDSTSAVMPADSSYTLPSFPDVYGVSQTKLACQAPSESLLHSQVLRPTPVPAAPLIDIPSGRVSNNLEPLYNFKSDNLQMPVQLSPYWKPANTNSVNSYAPPIMFASSSGPGLYQGSSHTGMPVGPTYENSAFGACTNLTNTYQQNPLYENNFGTDYSQSQLLLNPYHALNQQEASHHMYGLQSESAGAQPFAQGTAHQHCMQEKPSLDEFYNSYPDQSAQVIPESNHGSGAWTSQQKAPQYQTQSKPKLQQSRRDHPQIHENDEQLFLQQQLLVQKKRELFLQQQQINKAQLAKQFISGPDKKQGSHKPSISCDLLQPTSLFKKESGDKSFSSQPKLETLLLHKSSKTNSQLSSRKQQTPNLSLPCKSQQSKDAPQLGFSEFRGHNNQLSQQLIYDYLTSAENQLTSLHSNQGENLSNSVEQDVDKHLPMQVEASQSCYEINNSIFDDVLPTISKHLTSHELQLNPESARNLNASSEKLDDDPCLKSTTILESSLINTSYADIPVALQETQETSTNIYDHGGMEELPGKNNLPPIEAIPSDTPMSADETGIEVTANEFKHHAVTEKNSYVQLLPVPVCDMNFENMQEMSDDLIPLSAVQADSVTEFSCPFKSDDVLAIPLSSDIDSTLEKVVKEDESTNQAIFLCSDSTGEFEYMTLSVSQDEVFNNAADKNLSETLPATVSPSEDVLKDINMNEVPLIHHQSKDKLSNIIERKPPISEIVPPKDMKTDGEVVELPPSLSDSLGTVDILADIGSEIDEEEVPPTQRLSEDFRSDGNEEEASAEMLPSPEESLLNASEVSTIPVTSMEASTVTATSGLTDFLSTSSDMAVRPHSETTESQVPSVSGNVTLEDGSPSREVPSASTVGVRECDSLLRKVPSCCHSLPETSFDMVSEKGLTGITQNETPSLFEPKQEFSDSTTNLREPELNESKSGINNPSTEEVEPRRVNSTSDENISDVTEVSEISQQELSDCSCEKTDKVVKLPVADVNLNVPKQINVQCSVKLEQMTEDWNQESTVHLGTEPKAQDDGPVLRNRSTGKAYLWKQTRHPVRSSPRTSGRAGPSYTSQSSSLPLSRSASPRLVSAMQQPAKGRKSCSNADHGCVQALPPAQLSSHLLVCEFTPLECPAMGCNWHCIAKKLSFHIRDSHKPIIGAGTDSTHTVSIQEIHQLQLLTFLREVSRKLFVICIHSSGNSIFASMQYIAPARTEKPIVACGTIEVVDKTGKSHAWRGKIGPIQQSLSAIRECENCLQVPPEDIGSIFDESIITFHTNIRVTQVASSS